MYVQTWFKPIDEEGDIAIVGTDGEALDFINYRDIPEVIDFLQRQRLLHILRRDNGLHINSTETR